MISRIKCDLFRV